jgi:hypothetical protein
MLESEINILVEPEIMADRKIELLSHDTERNTCKVCKAVGSASEGAVTS